MTLEEQTIRLRALCDQMKLATTRMERERLLAQMAEVIREPTGKTMFAEGV